MSGSRPGVTGGEPEVLLKALFMGDWSSSKTEIFQRVFEAGEDENERRRGRRRLERRVIPVGAARVVLVDGFRTHVDMWNVSAETGVRRMLGADLIFLCYSVFDAASFRALTGYLQILRRIDFRGIAAVVAHLREPDRSFEEEEEDDDDEEFSEKEREIEENPLGARVVSRRDGEEFAQSIGTRYFEVDPEDPKTAEETFMEVLKAAVAAEPWNVESRKARRKQAHALASAIHPRLGEGSPVSTVDTFTLRTICELIPLEIQKRNSELPVFLPDKYGPEAIEKARKKKSESGCFLM